MQGRVEANINVIHPSAQVPAFGTPLSAGFDLAICEHLTLYVGEAKIARTGLVIQAPPDHMLLVVPRSSTFRKWGISLGNTVGIVDEDYCGPEDELRLHVLRVNYGENNTRKVPAGTRIAQGIFVPITRTTFNIVDGPIAPTRGGWGSTGD